MARKRMIDPSIWTDEGMAELTPRQQLLYIGLFSNADDDGRLKGSPVAVALMLPTLYSTNDRRDLEEDLSRVLSVMRQLSRYEVDGRPYLVFQNFRQWQRIDKPTASILPEPPSSTHDSKSDPEPFDEPSSKPPRKVPPKLTEEKGKEEKGSKQNENAQERESSSAPTSQPFALLETLCETLGQDVSVLSKSEKGRQLAVAKRLVDAGMTTDDVSTMVRWLKAQAWVTGGIDMFFLEKQHGKWALAGKPSMVPANLTRIEHPSRSTNASGQQNLTDQELDDIIYGRTG